MSDSRNEERRNTYAFKRSLEQVIREHKIDELSRVDASTLSSYLIRQLVALAALLENLDYK